MVARHRPELSGVGAGSRVVTREKDGAGGIDCLDPLDDLELGAVRAAGHDDVADAQGRGAVYGSGDDKSTRR